MGRQVMQWRAGSLDSESKRVKKSESSETSNLRNTTDEKSVLTPKVSQEQLRRRCCLKQLGNSLTFLPHNSSRLWVQCLQDELFRPQSLHAIIFPASEWKLQHHLAVDRLLSDLNTRTVSIEISAKSEKIVFEHMALATLIFHDVYSWSPCSGLVSVFAIVVSIEKGEIPAKARTPTSTWNVETDAGLPRVPRSLRTRRGK